MKAEPTRRPPPPPRQPIAQPPIQTQPVAGTKNAAMTRRGEADLRSLMQGLAIPSTAVTADGLVFAQLIQPVQTVSDDGAGLDKGSAAMAAKPDAAGEQLVDELAQRLPLAPGAFTATLLMPNLGKVQVRAGRREGRWEVELGFARRESFERLRSQQGSCEAALATAMNSTVQLSMVDEAAA